MLDPHHQFGSSPDLGEALQSTLFGAQPIEASLEDDPVEVRGDELRSALELITERIFSSVDYVDLTLEALEAQGRHLGEQDAAWVVGHSISADDAVELGDDLPDYLSRWLGALTPFYRYAAWTRDNDLIDATKKIQQDKADKHLLDYQHTNAHPAFMKVPSKRDFCRS